LEAADTLNAYHNRAIATHEVIDELINGPLTVTVTAEGAEGVSMQLEDGSVIELAAAVVPLLDDVPPEDVVPLPWSSPTHPASTNPQPSITRRLHTPSFARIVGSSVQPPTSLMSPRAHYFRRGLDIARARRDVYDPDLARRLWDATEAIVARV
jgi:hypothetical protein